MRRVFILLSIYLLWAGSALARDSFIVRVQTTSETPEALFSRLGFTLQRTVGKGDESVFLISSSAGLTPAGARRLLRSEAGILNIERVNRLALKDVDDDTYERVAARTRRYASSLSGRDHSNHTSVQYYGAPARWDYVSQPTSQTLRLRNVHRRFGLGNGVVAIIDTGVDPTHPALQESLVEGYDFTRDRAGLASELDDLDSTTLAELQQSTVAVLNQSTVAVLNQSTVAVLNQDLVDLLTNPDYRAFGHGTLVAGLVHLVAPRAKIMPLKAFRSDGSANTADIVSAIYFAEENGADVINMSFSFESFSPEVMRAINFVTRRGVVCISAVGNLADSALVYPASMSNVTGVAALGEDSHRSPDSSFGEDLVSVAAPGEALLSLYPGGGYARVFGTSFSSALVAGSAALLKGRERDSATIDHYNVERSLSMGRERTGELGYGPLDLFGALVWSQRNQRGR